MLYTKLEEKTYKGLAVNWANDDKHTPLVEEILEEILILMNSAVKDGEKTSFRPVLLRFDLESYADIERDVNKFISKMTSIHKTKHKYFKIYYQQEISKKEKHYHFISIVDGRKDYKSYSKFAINAQNIWNDINSEIELFATKDHYYKIWKKLEIDAAFYASSYLAKHRGKEDRIKFRQKNRACDNNRIRTPEDQESSLLRLRDVMALLNISKSAWYAGIKNGIFPKPYKLGPKTSVWKRPEIISLISSIQHS